MPKSISVRLLVIFILGFILLFTLLRLGIGHSFKQEVHQLQAVSVMQVKRIILDKHTQQVNFERAMRVAERTGMRIHIQTKQKSWSSHNQAFNAEEYQFTPFPYKRIKPAKLVRFASTIEIAHGFKVTLFKVTTAQATLFFEIDNHRGNFGWYFVLIAGSFILLLYLAIRHQFAPITEIKRVVREVSQGNFKARVKTKRQDDFGQLATQVNTMAEDIDRLIESKRSLLLSISHELRTPLTRAKISSSMADINQYRDSLLDDLAEMETIISDLTEAERLSEDMPLARQVTDINALINDVLQESFAKCHVSFSPLDDSPYINIDPIRTKLLVKNLLKNAVQYSCDDSIRPAVTLDLNDKFLTIHVVDRGIGMPADLLDRLTEPFYRLDQSRQRETGGFGLGLYLCKAITHAHHGQLTISSEPGYGTHVTASLALIEH